MPHWRNIWSMLLHKSIDADGHRATSCIAIQPVWYLTRGCAGPRVEVI